MTAARAREALTEPWLAAQAELRPDATALLCDRGESCTFAELEQSARAVARRLLAAGIGRGCRIGLLLQPSKRFVDLLHGAQRVGAAVVPFNDRLQDGELLVQLKNADPTWLVYDEPHAEVASRLAKLAPGVRTVEATGELDAMPIAHGSVPERMALSDVLSIVYTSGTTGAPKGVMLTNANHLASAIASMARLGRVEEDRWLSTLPLYHVGGLAILLRAAIHGMAVVLQSSFEAAAANRAIREWGVTIVSLVPIMLSRMLEDAGGRAYPPALRCALIGGGPVSPEIVQRAASLGVPVYTTYGLTETASQVTTTAAGEAASHPGSAGRPLDGVSVRIADPDFLGCGEILVQGPQVMAGYFRNPEATARAIAGGWLHTGDSGRLDQEGRLWVEARRSDLIITGGENVVPDEVEAVLARHPDVLEAAVYGVQDQTWGQRVATVVVLQPGVSLDVDGLTSFCKRQLAGYKVPRSFDVVKTLPRTPSGKAQRYRLRDSGL